MTTAMNAAARAAEAIRELNHATAPWASWDAGTAEPTSPTTRPTTGYRDASDVYSVLSDLQVMASRLPQALDRARAWLDRVHAESRLGHDGLGPALAPIRHGALPDALNDLMAYLRMTLTTAEHDAEGLARTLQIAVNHTSHLTSTHPEDADDPGADPEGDGGDDERGDL